MHRHDIPSINTINTTSPSDLKFLYKILFITLPLNIELNFKFVQKAMLPVIMYIRHIKIPATNTTKPVSISIIPIGGIAVNSPAEPASNNIEIPINKENIIWYKNNPKPTLKPAIKYLEKPLSLGSLFSGLIILEFTFEAK